MATTQQSSSPADTNGPINPPKVKKKRAGDPGIYFELEFEDPPEDMISFFADVYLPIQGVYRKAGTASINGRGPDGNPKLLFPTGNNYLKFLIPFVDPSWINTGSAASLDFILICNFQREDLTGEFLQINGTIENEETFSGPLEIRKSNGNPIPESYISRPQNVPFKEVIYTTEGIWCTFEFPSDASEGGIIEPFIQVPNGSYSALLCYPRFGTNQAENLRECYFPISRVSEPGNLANYIMDYNIHLRYYTQEGAQMEFTYAPPVGFMPYSGPFDIVGTAG